MRPSKVDKQEAYACVLGQFGWKKKVGFRVVNSRWGGNWAGFGRQTGLEQGKLGIETWDLTRVRSWARLKASYQILDRLLNATKFQGVAVSIQAQAVYSKKLETERYRLTPVLEKASVSFLIKTTFYQKDDWKKLFVLRKQIGSCQHSGITLACPRGPRLQPLRAQPVHTHLLGSRIWSLPCYPWVPPITLPLSTVVWCDFLCIWPNKSSTSQQQVEGKYRAFQRGMIKNIKLKN